VLALVAVFVSPVMATVAAIAEFLFGSRKGIGDDEL
jgi:hypothetical protein